MGAPNDRHPSLDDRFDPAMRIVTYDPQWPFLAAAELERIGQTLGSAAVCVEHVGSTAVPGLAAKPILDLQLSVEPGTPVESYRKPLVESLRYLYVPDPASPDYQLFAKPSGRPRTYHLHVCERGSRHEARHLAVRDFLRSHPEEAGAYAALKKDLAARRPGDRLAYIEGKAAYVDRLEMRASNWKRSEAQ